MTRTAIKIASLGPDRVPVAMTGRRDSARIEALPLAELPQRSASDFALVAVSSHIDQRGLQRQASWLNALLDNGGVLQWNGPVAHSPLPDLQGFVPQPQRNLEQLRVHRLADHALMHDISGEALTFRRGVAGFWGRGHNPAPPGALLLNGLGPDPETAPVDWLWQRPGGGWILMHAGNDWLTFAQPGTPAERLTDNLIDWARAVHLP